MKHLRTEQKAKPPRSTSSKPSSFRRLVPKRRTLIDVGIAAAVAVGSIATLLRLREIGRSAKGLVTDGQRVFSPGQLVSEQAMFGIVIVAVSLAAILIAAFLGRNRSSTIVLTAVFAVVCLGAAMFAFATYQQYKGFLPIS